MVKVGNILVTAVLVSAILLSSCGRTAEESEVEVQEVASQMISAGEGGNITVTEEDSPNLAGLQLNIPIGALDVDQEISIGEVISDDLSPLPEDHLSLGCRVSLKPDGLSFNSPIVIKIPLSEEKWHAWENLVSREDFKLVKYNHSSRSWTVVPSYVDDTGVVTAEISGFSVWDTVLFWKSDNPASRDKIEELARFWMPDHDWEYVENRLDRTPMFVGNEDLTFAEAIGCLLLAEDMWEKLSDGNFYAAVTVVEAAAETLPMDLLKLAAKAVIGMASPLSLLTIVANVAIRYGLMNWDIEGLNAQIRRYLSWRGWFYIADGTWVYQAEHDWGHDWVMEGWWETLPIRDGTGRFVASQPLGGGYQREIPGLYPPEIDLDQLFNDLGPTLVELLDKAYENGLQDDRNWLWRWFKELYRPPRIEISAADSVIVGEEMTLDGTITVGLLVNEEITIREGEADKLAGRPVVWEWKQTAGPLVNLDTQRLRQSIILTELGEYAFELHVRDTLVENHNLASVVVTCIEEGPDKAYLTVTSTAGGSVTTPGEGTYDYDAGTTVNLVATPASGYRFVNWAGDVGAIANINAATTTVTMNSDYSITANFAVIPPVQYDLTISSTAGGTVTTPGEGSFTYNAGTVIDLVATPASGYRFVNWTGDVGAIANINAATTTVTMNSDYSIIANFVQITMVAAGSRHTVGLKSNGTVVAVGYNSYGKCNVDGWTDIIQVAAGVYHTVGVKSDGTVVAVGRNDDGKCNVDGWTDIIQVAAGVYHTVGVKSDGTVVAVGSNDYGECNVDGWTDIVQVATGDDHTVGVKSDGTVVAVGSNDYGECNVDGWTGIIQVAAGDLHTVGLESDGTVVSVGYGGLGQRNVGGWTDIIQVAAGDLHTVGLKSDGTVVAVGSNSYGKCNVDGWTDITQVAAGDFHTVGLKYDGTVVAVGWNYFGQCNVDSWTGITQVAAGDYHTMGLESDGTVVAVGWNSDGQCNVEGWTDIVQVAAGWDHTVGLKSDGTVVATGDNNHGQCDVSGWMDIGQVAAGGHHTVGLEDDGTVVAVGWNSDGQCNVEGWTDIVQVAAGGYHTVGLKYDGTVVAVGWNSGQCSVGGWTDITQVAAGNLHTVGVKSDSTVVAVGRNDYEQCNVEGWTDIVQVAAGDYHTVGVKSDSTVVAVGSNDYGECNVDGWTGIIQVAAGGYHTVGLRDDSIVVATGPDVELAKWNLIEAVP